MGSGFHSSPALLNTWVPIRDVQSPHWSPRVYQYLSTPNRPLKPGCGMNALPRPNPVGSNTVRQSTARRVHHRIRSYPCHPLGNHWWVEGDFPTGHSLGRKPKVAHNTHTRASEIRFYAGFEEVLLMGEVNGGDPRVSAHYVSMNICLRYAQRTRQSGHPEEWHSRARPGPRPHAWAA